MRPLTDHLAQLGNPSWYARFAAQAMADAAYREVVTKDALSSPQLVQTLHGINRCLPDLPKRVRFERMVMAGNLLMRTRAEHEGGLAEDGPRSRSPWPLAAEGLIGAIAGLWQAPVRAIAARGSSNAKNAMTNSLDRIAADIPDFPMERAWNARWRRRRKLWSSTPLVSRAGCAVGTATRPGCSAGLGHSPTLITHPSLQQALMQIQLARNISDSLMPVNDTMCGLNLN